MERTTEVKVALLPPTVKLWPIHFQYTHYPHPQYNA